MIKRKVTSKDIAELAGVSRTTVSFVLNGNKQASISEETRKRVLAAIEELDYEPDARAQALRSGNTKMIGLMIPDIRNPHFWEIAEGVADEARAAGYHLLLSSAEFDPENEKEIFIDLARRRTDGLILMGEFLFQSEEAQKTLDQLLRRRLPIVKLDGDPQIDSVNSDYREPTEQLIAYLLSLGHRRIGLIYGVGWPQLGEDRLVPYRESLLKAGLFHPELLVECGPQIEDGYQAAVKLLKMSPRPTALIAINDLLAMGVLRAAGDLGLHVPADLSLASYDDIPMAKYLVPRLTTASKDASRLGREAVDMVLARIQEPERPRQTRTCPARMIIRESTGPAPVI